MIDNDLLFKWCVIFMLFILQLRQIKLREFQFFLIQSLFFIDFIKTFQRIGMLT